MKRFYFLLTLVTMACSLPAFSQTVTGVVADSSGEPLTGALVSVKGKHIATTTGAGGRYSISGTGAADSLSFSYIGKPPLTVAIGGRISVDVRLEDSYNALDDIVVIGYGSVRRGDLTGAVSSVSSEEILRMPSNSVGEALTGRIAGMQVMTTDGAPDAEITMLVRGRNSITQSSAPLYIVDGFQVESISDISASDIESIDVLKDASSTAIYGSRGANGVIMVTTKSAKENGIKVAFNVYAGLKRMAPSPAVLDPYEYALWHYEQSAYRGEISSRYEPYFGLYEDMGLYKGYKGNNWKDIVFGKTGSVVNYNVSVSGKTDKMNYTATYAHQRDDAIMITSGYKRHNLTFKFQHRPLKNLTLDFNTRFSNTEITGSGANEQTSTSSSDTRLKYVMQYSPIPMKFREVAGEEETSEDDFNALSSLFTPTEFIRDNDRIQKRKNLNLSGGFSWTIIKNLTFRSNLSLLYDWSEDQRFYGVTTYYSRQTSSVKDHPANSIANTDKSRIHNFNTLEYNFRGVLPENHELTFMIGEETIVAKDRTLTTNTDGFPVDFDARQSFKFTSMGTPVKNNNFYGTPYKLLSFFARANYTLNGKYILTASMRTDGSSKFTVPTQGGYNNLWGYFPSAAVAWRISGENFLKDRKWLADLKLRASFGLAGNDNIPSAQTLAEFTVNTTSLLPFDSSTSWLGLGNNMPNPGLRWETTTSRNLGLDFGFFDHRLSGSVDLYLNTTRDLLIRFPVKGVGYTDRYSNIGATQNKGIEINLNGIILQKKNVDLLLSFNVAMNRNKVLDLGGLDMIQAYSSWASTTIDYDFIIREGEPLGQIYGFISDGRYDASDFTWNNGWVANAGVVDNRHFAGNAWGPGAIKFRDIGGDPLLITTADDRTVLGCTQPKATGGFVLSGRVYGFDFNANFNYTLGNKILNVNKAEYTSTGSYRFQNMLTTMDSSNRWRGVDENGQLVTDVGRLAEMNANTTMWNPLTAYRSVNSWIVEDGSFLRLSAATVGYTLPARLTRKAKIESLRVYVTGTNLLLFTKYTGFDPEVDTRRATPLTPGVDYSPYPKTRGVIFGLNLNF